MIRVHVAVVKSIKNAVAIKNNRFHNGYRLKEIEASEELSDVMEMRAKSLVGLLTNTPY